MRIEQFKAILANAEVVARKMNSDRVTHTRKYLQDNGVNASFTDVCWFLLGRNVSLYTDKDITDAFGDIVDFELDPPVEYNCSTCIGATEEHCQECPGNKLSAKDEYFMDLADKCNDELERQQEDEWHQQHKLESHRVDNWVVDHSDEY